MKLRARAAAVNLWTSPADRRAPFGACGQPVDNALGRVVIDRAFRRALPTGCPHSRTSRPQPHSFSNKIFFSKKREGPNRKKGTFLLCVDKWRSAISVSTRSVRNSQDALPAFLLRRLLVPARGPGAAADPGMALVADEPTPAPSVLIRNPGSRRRFPVFSAIKPAAPQKLRTVDVARYVFGGGICRPICRRLSDLRDPARLVQKSQTPREILRVS